MVDYQKAFADFATANKQAAEAIEAFTAVLNDMRLKFEATLTDAERVVYHERLSEGFGILEAQTAVEAYRIIARQSPCPILAK